MNVAVVRTAQIDCANLFSATNPREKRANASGFFVCQETPGGLSPPRTVGINSETVG